jgi:hypothetical protein
MTRRRRNLPAIQPHTFDLLIGTMLHVTDGFTDSLAQIADIETDSWGTYYVVVKQDGTMTKVGYVAPKGTKGIGWSVASDEWIALLS